jgi:hypothetical protein
MRKFDSRRGAEEECGIQGERSAVCSGFVRGGAASGVRHRREGVVGPGVSERGEEEPANLDQRRLAIIGQRAELDPEGVVPRDRLSRGPKGVPVEAILVGGRRPGVPLGDVRRDGSDRLRQLINRGGLGEWPVRLSIEGVALDRVRREPIRLHRPERIPGLRRIPRGDPCVKCWKCARGHACTMPRAYAPCVIESPLLASIARLTSSPALRIPLPHAASGRAPLPAFLFRPPHRGELRIPHSSSAPRPGSSPASRIPLPHSASGRISPLPSRPWRYGMILTGGGASGIAWSALALSLRSFCLRWRRSLTASLKSASRKARASCS